MNRTTLKKWLFSLAVCLILVVAGYWQFREPPVREMPEDPSVLTAVEKLVAQAENAAGAGQGQTARLLISRALKLLPDHPKSLLYHSTFLHEDGRTDEAQKALARVSGGDPKTNSTARFLEGRIFMDLGLARKAEERFQRSAELNQAFAGPLKELAGLYLLQMRRDELLRILDRLAAVRVLTPDQLAARILAGLPMVEEVRAKAVLERFVQQDSADTASLAALIRYATEARNLTEALKWSDEIRQLNQTASDPEVQSLLGSVCLMQEDLKGVAAVLPGKFTQGPGVLSLLKFRSQLAMREQDWNTVRGIGSYLVSELPFDVEVHHNLAAALERLQEHELAARLHVRTELLDRLERLAYLMQQPQAASPAMSVPVIVEIADILRQCGQHQASSEWISAGLVIDARSPELLRLQQSVPADISSVERLLPATTFPEIPVWKPGVGNPEILATGERSKRAVSLTFEDVAAEHGLDFQYFNGQSPSKLIVETVGGGAGVLDFDGDGRPDIYFPQGAGNLTASDIESPTDSSVRLDRLFRNLGSRGFDDCTLQSGIEERSHSLSCTVADFDNDGFSDVLVVNVGFNRLYQNQGDGTFLDVTPASLATHADCSSAAAFADLNLDGFPDLYVVNYVAGWERVCRNSRGEVATCDPREFAAASDRLFQNSGDGNFTDVTEAAGITDEDGKGLGVVIANLDQDRLPDIYVANDGTRNFLFRNQSTDNEIRLLECGLQSGVAVNGQGRSEAGMGIACADFDNNSHLDLFVTNFYRETNTLYAGLGQMLFEDRTRLSGLDEASFEVLGFGTQPIDIDLNGLTDLVVLNGDIDDYSAFGRPWKMKPQVFRNEGGSRFTEVSADAGPYFQQPALGRGLIRLDFDGDGRQDLLAVHHDRPASLLKNVSEVSSGLSLRLISVNFDRDAVGANLTSSCGSFPVTLSVHAGDGFAASCEHAVVFGLQTANESRVSVDCQTANTRFTVELLSRPGEFVIIDEQGGKPRIWNVPR